MDFARVLFTLIRKNPVKLAKLSFFVPLSAFFIFTFLFLFSAQYSVYRRQLFVQYALDQVLDKEPFALKFSQNNNEIVKYSLNLDESSEEQCLTYKPVQISLPDQNVPVFTCKDTDEAVLGEVFPEKVHEITISQPPTVFEGKIIAATPVKKVAALMFEPVGYNVETLYTNTLEDGKKVVMQAGQVGSRAKVVEKVIYPDEKEKENVIATWVEKEPVTEKIQIGTKRVMKTTTIDGVTFQYWKTLDVVATSYDKNCKGCNEWTATGAYLKKGIVAVDPKVIKMHTKMYIPGYGFGQAEDTGGAIKGNKIDLAFEDVRYGNWSKRTVTIYLIN